MRRIFTFVVAVIAVMAFAAPAFAGNPHFVGEPTVVRDGDVLVVDGKIAGLGNETQVNVEVSAFAECVNPGGNLPSADNKDEVSVDDVFPVQNGKADFHLELDGVAQINPSCQPPMTVVYSDVVVTDLTHGLIFEVDGTF